MSPLRKRSHTPFVKIPAAESVGKVYGLLYVESIHHYDANFRAWVQCQCECGIRPILNLSSMRAGNTSSCGCLMRKINGEREYKHGRHKTTEYQIYHAMMQRCYNQKSTAYRRYGGRGITVCKRWRKRFINFLADMGQRPSGKTLERKDNNGPYCLRNCKWATRDEQDHNKSTNVWITFKGETKIIADWAREKGIPGATISDRLNKQGMTVEQALTIPHVPSRTHRPTHSIEGLRIVGDVGRLARRIKTDARVRRWI
jgi:hypothetical protein